MVINEDKIDAQREGELSTLPSMPRFPGCQQKCEREEMSKMTI